jgi:phosphohistidine phosphatase
MDIYLLRHGKAEEHYIHPRDRDRRLTPEGVASMEEEIPGIKSRVPRLDAILSSPYPRAYETADIAARAFGLEGKVEHIDALCLDGGEQDTLDRLKQFPPDASVMLVGHSPLMGELAEFLTASGAAYGLKKGGLCKISFPGNPEHGKGNFEWILKPKDLKQE